MMANISKWKTNTNKTRPSICSSAVIENWSENIITYFYSQDLCISEMGLYPQYKILTNTPS